MQMFFKKTAIKSPTRSRSPGFVWAQTRKSVNRYYLTINSIAAFRSSSVQSAHRPFGGIAPLPAFELATSASIPAARRGAHASASCALGAPATPAAWQLTQALLYTASPSAAKTPELSSAAAAKAITFFIVPTYYRVDNNALKSSERIYQMVMPESIYELVS